MAIPVEAGLIYSLQSATRGRLVSQCLIFHIVPKQTPARNEIRGMNAFVVRTLPTHSSRDKTRFRVNSILFCVMSVTITVVSQSLSPQQAKKKERERENCDMEGPVCLPRLWLTFKPVVLDDVTIDDSGAHTKKQTPALPPSLTPRRLSFTLLSRQPWRSLTTCATRLHCRQDRR